MAEFLSETSESKMRPISRRVALPLLTLAALGACGIRGASSVDDVMPGRVIRAREIQKLGARDAWEVIKRVGVYSTRETEHGKAQKVWRRGRGSIMLDEAPLVVVDGVLMEDFRVLQEIDVRNIELIRLLNSVEGTHFYGAPGGAGAIIIQTRHTSDQVRDIRT